MEMDDAMFIRPMNRRNQKRLFGFEFKKTTRYARMNADVFIFNNPYRKMNIDLVFFRGQFFISDAYGETMDRETIFYVPIYERGLSYD